MPNLACRIAVVAHKNLCATEAHERLDPIVPVSCVKRLYAAPVHRAAYVGNASFLRDM